MNDRGFQHHTKPVVVGDVVMKRCPECKETKVRAEHFYVSRRVGGVAYYAVYCSACTAVKTAEYKAARKARDPAYVKRVSARKMAWLAADEERRVRARAASKRWKEKIKREQPEEYLRQLELARIAHRLRRERRGLPVRPDEHKRTSALSVASGPSYLPTAPLVVLIEEMLGRREAVAGLIADVTPTLKGVCMDLGIDERTFRRWQKGTVEHVRVGTAERVLLAAAAGWPEVYSYDDHAELYAEGGVLEGAS